MHAHAALPPALTATVVSAHEAAEDAHHAAVKVGVLLHDAARLPDARAAAELRRIATSEVYPLTHLAARALAASALVAAGIESPDAAA